jgi:hypothetical protein
MDSTHMRWLEESLGKNTVQKILKAENGRIGKDKESMTEKRNQRDLLWFQTGGALNFITAAPHCGVIVSITIIFSTRQVRRQQSYNIHDLFPVFLNGFPF